MKQLFRLLILLFICLPVLSPHGIGQDNGEPSAEGIVDKSTWHEVQWSAYLAKKMDGVAEFKTTDRSRVDILTKDVAYEVDWSHKWPEGVGQALFYGLATGRQPGLILLAGKNNTDMERIYFLRALSVCARYDIKLHVININK